MYPLIVNGCTTDLLLRSWSKLQDFRSNFLQIFFFLFVSSFLLFDSTKVGAQQLFSHSFSLLSKFSYSCDASVAPFIPKWTELDFKYTNLLHIWNGGTTTFWPSLWPPTVKVPVEFLPDFVFLFFCCCCSSDLFPGLNFRSLSQISFRFFTSYSSFHFSSLILHKSAQCDASVAPYIPE